MSGGEVAPQAPAKTAYLQYQRGKLKEGKTHKWIGDNWNTMTGVREGGAAYRKALTDYLDAVVKACEAVKAAQEQGTEGAKARAAKRATDFRSAKGNIVKAMMGAYSEAKGKWVGKTSLSSINKIEEFKKLGYDAEGTRTGGAVGAVVGCKSNGLLAEQVDYLYKALDPRRRGAGIGVHMTYAQVEHIIKAYWKVIESMLITGRCVRMLRIGILQRAKNINGKWRIKLTPSRNVHGLKKLFRDSPAAKERVHLLEGRTKQVFVSKNYQGASADRPYGLTRSQAAFESYYSDMIDEEKEAAVRKVVNGDRAARKAAKDKVKKTIKKRAKYMKLWRKRANKGTRDAYLNQPMQDSGKEIRRGSIARNNGFLNAASPRRGRRNRQQGVGFPGREYNQKKLNKFRASRTSGSQADEEEEADDDLDDPNDYIFASGSGSRSRSRSRSRSGSPRRGSLGSGTGSGSGSGNGAGPSGAGPSGAGAGPSNPRGSASTLWKHKVEWVAPKSRRVTEALAIKLCNHEPDYYEPGDWKPMAKVIEKGNLTKITDRATRVALLMTKDADAKVEGFMFVKEDEDGKKAIQGMDFKFYRTKEDKEGQRKSTGAVLSLSNAENMLRREAGVPKSKSKLHVISLLCGLPYKYASQQLVWNYIRDFDDSDVIFAAATTHGGETGAEASAAAYTKLGFVVAQTHNVREGESTCTVVVASVAMIKKKFKEKKYPMPARG